MASQVLARVVTGCRFRSHSGWANLQESGYGYCRDELQSQGSEEKSYWTSIGYNGHIRYTEASELLWLLLVGYWNAAACRQCVLLGWVRNRTLEVLFEKDKRGGAFPYWLFWE